MTHEQIRAAVLSDPELRELWVKQPEDHAGKGYSPAKLVALRRFETRLSPVARQRIAVALGVPIVDVLIAKDLEREGRP